MQILPYLLMQNEDDEDPNKDKEPASKGVIIGQIILIMGIAFILTFCIYAAAIVVRTR